VSEAATRQRLAAILAADVSGYSRLMACDEPGTVSALDAAREVFARRIESLQGRVIDMAGDSVLAVFETAAGAVGTALAVQQELNARAEGQAEACRMRFRIGVHLGDVIEKADGTIYGDGVNTAARLEALAEPGGVCVSDAVECALRHRVAATFDDLGEQMLKNLPKPVRAYRLRATAPARPGAAPAQPERVDKPAIAVLPFDNMSGEAEQEFFADGITEDIITELSRFRGLFVISRNSAFESRGVPSEQPSPKASESAKPAAATPAIAIAKIRAMRPERMVRTVPQGGLGAKKRWSSRQGGRRRRTAVC